MRLEGWIFSGWVQRWRALGFLVIWSVLMPPPSRAHPQRVRVDNWLSASCAATRFMFNFLGLVIVFMKVCRREFRDIKGSSTKECALLLLGRLVFSVCIFSGCAPFRKVLCIRHRSHMCPDPLVARRCDTLVVESVVKNKTNHRSIRRPLRPTHPISQIALSRFLPNVYSLSLSVFRTCLASTVGSVLSQSELLRFSSRCPLGSGQLAAF